MSHYQTMLFDLDDTLLDRDMAVEKMFLVILENCYGAVGDSAKKEMLHAFKEYDNRSYGKSNKVIVLKSLFDDFPPKYRLPDSSIMEFWNQHFPDCFSINPEVLHIVNQIKMHAKIGIITNGSTHRQKAKIMNTHLDDCFDMIMISEEAGYWKPDKRIFESALNKLGVKQEAALFVGDDLEKDRRLPKCQYQRHLVQSPFEEQ